MGSSYSGGSGWGWGSGGLWPGIGQLYEHDDETGASWGPEYHGLSLADGQAFARVQGVDLSPYAGTEGSASFRLDLHDSLGNTATGWVGAQDVAEALVSSLVVNGSFDDWTGGDADDWNESNCDTSEDTVSPYGGSGSSCTITASASNGNISQNVTVEAGKLYKLSFVYKNEAGDTARFSVRDVTHSVNIIGTTNLDDSTSWSSAVERYVTAPIGTTTIRLYFYAAGNGDVVYFDAVSLREVTHVGTDGVHVVAARTSATRNWGSIDSGFRVNDNSGYTFEVLGLAAP
jgi:hypothetical protein